MAVVRIGAVDRNDMRVMTARMVPVMRSVVTSSDSGDRMVALATMVTVVTVSLINITLGQ